MSTLARQPRITSLHVFCAVIVVAIVARPLLGAALATPAVGTAATVFVAVCVQALPFLVLGVLAARFAGSLATACVTGWLWARLGRPAWVTNRLPPAPAFASRWAVLAETNDALIGANISQRMRLCSPTTLRITPRGCRGRGPRRRAR